MKTASIFLQLVSVGLLVYVLVKILEVEKSVEDLKETEYVKDGGEEPPVFRPIATPPNTKEEIVELENDESVVEDDEQ